MNQEKTMKTALKFGVSFAIAALALLSTGAQAITGASASANWPELMATVSSAAGQDFASASAQDDQESRDREQEKRDREQEKRDREQEARDRAQEARDRAQEKLDRAQELYERGTEALDEDQWQKAVDIFIQAAAQEKALAASERSNTNIEGALYWQAYAQNKLGHQAEALATLKELTSTYPQSRWANEAKHLDLEVRQSSGQVISPESQSDEDMKIMVLDGLMGSDPERVVPMLEKLLEGNQPPKIKEKALFVLCQSGSPKAREIVARIARGGSNPDLQMKALNDLGLFGGKESRKELADIYESTSDLRVKRAILHSFMISGDRERLFAAAKSEKSPELRSDAIHQLGLTGAQSELWQLYQAEPTVEVKAQILHSMFLAGNADKLLEAARGEKDPKLRRAAIHSLGLMGSSKTGDALNSMYSSEKDPDIKREIINAYFIQGNAHALVEIAKQEKDPQMKREAVQKISLMGSKEGTDYLMELLNK